MKQIIAPSGTAPRADRVRGTRRRENRIRVNIPVRIIYQGLLSEVTRDGLCTDISEAGVSFQTQAGLYVGEFVELEFRSQNAAPFRFQVRLLYKTGNRYGAYFATPDGSSNDS